MQPKFLLSIVYICLFIHATLQNPLANYHKHGNKILFANSIIDTIQYTPHNEYSQNEDEEKQFHVHVKGNLDAKLRAKLQQELESDHAHYIPHNTFVLVTTPKKLKQVVHTNQDIVWTSEAAPEYKIDPDLEKLLNSDGLETENLSSDMIQHLPKNMRRYMKKVPGIDVLVIPTKRRDAQMLATTWQDELLRGQNISVKFEPASKTKLSVYVNRKEHLPKVVRWLARKHEAVHLQPQEKFSLLEADVLSDVLFTYWVGQRNLPNVTYLWEKGLDGEGEIVGAGDTGIDHTNCAFHDPTRPVPFNKIDTKHRKIAGYWTVGDAKDLVDGHGTHVVGSLVGNAPEQPHFSGILPKSKIVFVDIGLPSGQLKLPLDLATGYFPKMHPLAKITSNSWGNPRYGAYTLSSREVDQYSWENKDFLAIFAAGNSGRDGFNTITSPGTAKNCLTVGSSQRDILSFSFGHPIYAELMASQFKTQMCNSESMFYQMPSVCENYGAKAPCNHLAEKICKNWKGAEECCKNEVTKKICCPEYLAKMRKKHPEQFSEHNVAPFSSRGPTRDGRIKPEIIAPGQPIFSVRSDGTSSKPHCTKPLVMQGTSMSAPIVAGYAMMIRQYFTKGFYPTGKPTPEHARNPSGALLKAMIINSGTNLNGMVDVNGEGHMRRLDPVPSVIQGYGRVDLTSVLPFANESKFSLFVHESSISTGNVHEFCFTSKDFFKTTITWMDYPASPAAKISLVNNLDLQVITDDNTIYYGNGAVDYVNNVEQIHIKRKSGTYKLLVKGVTIPHGPQDYALVVTGGQLKKVSCTKEKPRSSKIIVMNDMLQ